MLRILLTAACLAVVPAAIAQEFPLSDDALVEMFDADGPDVTDGVPTGDTGTPDIHGVQLNADVQASCGGSFDSERDVSDPCSGWYVDRYVDFGDGPEPVYFNCQMDLAAGRTCTPDPDTGDDEEEVDEPEEPDEN